MKAQRRPIEELTPEQRERCCPSCRVRYKFPTPAPRDLYGPLQIDSAAYLWLVNAAKVWDAEATELYPASEFVAWLKADLAGHHVSHADHDGAPPRYESGVHRHPDPIPFAELPRSWRR